MTHSLFLYKRLYFPLLSLSISPLIICLFIFYSVFSTYLFSTVPALYFCLSQLFTFFSFSLFLFYLCVLDIFLFFSHYLFLYFDIYFFSIPLLLSQSLSVYLSSFCVSIYPSYLQCYSFSVSLQISLF